MDKNLTAEDLIMYKAETLVLARKNSRLAAVKHIYDTARMVTRFKPNIKQCNEIVNTWLEGEIEPEANNYTLLQEENERLKKAVNNIPHWLNESARILELYAEKNGNQSTLSQKLRWYADNIETAINKANNINQ